MLSLAFFLQGFPALTRQSITGDEPSFIGSGYVNLKYGDFRLNPAAPPLMQQIEALPLMFIDIKSPPYSETMNIDPQGHGDFGRVFLFESGNDFRRIAFLSRLPVLIIGTLLVLSIFLWGRRLFGDGPALVGTAAAAFSPNLLAHSEIATTDLGCSALMFASVWAFHSAIGKRRVRDWVLCGFVTGLALFSKYTALLLGPAYLMFFGLLMYRRHPAAKPEAMAKALGIVGLVSLLVVGAGYNFTFDWKRYIWGISQIYADHASDNYWNYLLGGVSQEPFWYYNLVGLATKVPVSTLMLLVIAAVAFAASRKEGDAAFFLIVPSMLVITASFLDKTNLGLRRILPALPFLFLFASYAALGAKGRLRPAALAVLLGWSAFQSISITPHHLSYFNTLAGGPERGPYIFDDSNVDWGQDLVYLADWQRAHPDVQLKLSYHGPAVPAAYGVHAIEYHHSEDIEHPRPGVYAVSAHKLVWYRKMHLVFGSDTDWMSKYKPISRAGYSIYIYSFD